MSDKQKWTTIILTFILLLTIIIGGYTIGVLSSVERVLSSPAATSKIDIDADMWFEMSKDGELQLSLIHI